MKKVFLLAGLLSALVLTSCKKDKDNGGDNGGGNNPGTAKLLKKTTETQNGVTTVFNFTYDNNKRLISYAMADGTEKTLFSYDGAGNLTAIEITDQETKIVYSYTYANGIPVSGKIKSWDLNGAQPDVLVSESDLTFTVANGQVTKVKRVIKGEDMDDVVLNLSLTYTNGNLSKIQTTEGSSYAYTATFVFGDKKSPFPQISKWILDDSGFSVMISSKNELKSAAYDMPGQEMDYGFTNTYTYDAAGYPITSSDGEVTVKYEYQ